MDHDAAHKFIYALPEVAADLLHLVAPDWVEDLDLTTLAEVSSEFLDEEHRRRVGDMLWKVHFRSGVLKDGGRPYILALLEFQSSVDRNMAKRMSEYSDMLRNKLVHDRVVTREGGLPWLLPLVVYNGSRSWTAPGEAADMVSLPSTSARRDLALLQPQAYLRLDVGARTQDDWPLGNRVAATARLQRSETPKGLLGQLREELERFPSGANAAYRRALYAWARALWSHMVGDTVALPTFEELEQDDEGGNMTTLLETKARQWEAEWLAQGIAQGIKKGRAEEGVRLIERQVALKFGARTAKRLSGLMDGLTPRQEHLDLLSDWTIECRTAEDLLARVDGLRASEHRQDHP